MPRDGSIILSDVREPTLAIVCEPCGRRGVYSVARLMGQYGDARLTDLLHALAGCPKAHSVSVHDRCKAVYGQRLPEGAPEAIASTAGFRARGATPTPTSTGNRLREPPPCCLW